MVEPISAALLLNAPGAPGTRTGGGDAADEDADEDTEPLFLANNRAPDGLSKESFLVFVREILLFIHSIAIAPFPFTPTGAAFSDDDERRDADEDADDADEDTLAPRPLAPMGANFGDDDE